MNKKTFKENKSKGKKRNKNPDAYERINFLHQAAKLNLVINPQNEELSRYYMKNLRTVKEKKCLKLSRDMKHSICNGCNMLLVPGITTRVRVGDHKCINMTCLTCNNKKRFHIRSKAPLNSNGAKKKRHKNRKKLNRIVVALEE